MIIAIDASGKVALNEASDFKGFKVTTPNTDSAFLTKALAAAGRYDDSHAWISQSWLIDQGKAHGAAWREGFKHAMGDVVLVQDADLEYDPAEYPRLIQPILDGRADVVYGSRFMVKRAARVMAVIRPLKVVIDNYPEGQVEQMEAVNNPEDASAGTRLVPFSRVLYIEQEDFREDPPKQYYRLSPGREVRLRYGYFVTCTSVVKNDRGEVVEVHCTYDPATRGGNAPDGRKVKATIHWVSAAHATDAEVRLYDRLFTAEEPTGDDWLTQLNPESLEVLRCCKLEGRLADAAPGSRWQFERMGYFCADALDSRPGAPVWNRTVTLKDTCARIERRQAG